MKLKSYTLRQIRAGTRVLMRIDANVPIERGRVQSKGDHRIMAVLPEVERLLKRGANITLMSHVGRPGGKNVSELSIEPIRRYLNKKLSQEVTVLENLRFNKGEKQDSASFAKKLAKHGDIYINNAFGVCHRKHASVHAITKYIDSYAGQLLQKEVRELSKPYKHPAVLVIGGIKLESKIPVIDYLSHKVDHILTAGGVAVALIDVERDKNLFAGGRIISEKDRIYARRILREHAAKIHLPIDFGVARTENFRSLKRKDVADMRSKDRLFDIGPKTIKHYADLINGSRTVIWNGPMGLVERPAAAKGTDQIAKIITSQKRTHSIVGGGDTVGFLEKKNRLKSFSFVSTGGGAMLAFLGGKKMPGLEVLQK